MGMAHIHPTAVISSGAQLGDNVHIGAYCTIGPGVILHDRVHVHAHVSITGATEIGEACEIHPFVALGGIPQDTSYKGEDTRLVIGARNIIREHVTMHIGTSAGRGITEVGDDGYYMVGSHIGHDCRVGNNVTLANNVALGGHVQVGDYATLSGLVGVHQFTRIGKYAFAGAQASLMSDLIPYGMAVGHPACLNGLNMVGLKRNGFSRATIRQLRALYKDIFTAGPGLFEERVAAAAQTHQDCPQAQDVIAFIRAKTARPLCLPQDRKRANA